MALPGKRNMKRWTMNNNDEIRLDRHQPVTFALLLVTFGFLKEIP
jgi:hypothetical protein